MKIEGETIMNQVFRFTFPNMLTSGGKGNNAMGNMRLIKRQRTKLQDVQIRLPDVLVFERKMVSVDPAKSLFTQFLKKEVESYNSLCDAIKNSINLLLSVLEGQSMMTEELRLTFDSLMAG
jgi:hypothetical protein